MLTGCSPVRSNRSMGARRVRTTASLTGEAVRPCTCRPRVRVQRQCRAVVRVRTDLSRVGIVGTAVVADESSATR